MELDDESAHVLKAVSSSGQRKGTVGESDDAKGGVGVGDEATVGVAPPASLPELQSTVQLDRHDRYSSTEAAQAPH